jgi:hypothetical protein
MFLYAFFSLPAGQLCISVIHVHVSMEPPYSTKITQSKLLTAPNAYLLSSSFTTTSIKICLACQETEYGIQKLKLNMEYFTTSIYHLQ